MESSKAIILSYSPEPEKICASAARISNTLGTAIQIYEKTGKDNIGNMISRVLSLGHKSFIEHVNFTIAFENVSAFAEQFMIEFRLASFTVKSRRYVDFSNMGYYRPVLRFSKDLTENETENESENETVNEKGNEKVLKEYDQHMGYLFNEYNYFLESGIPKEDARFILPYSYRSNFYCTVNARELIHIIYAAIYGRGSRFPELKNLGNSLLKQAMAIIPDIFGCIERVETGNEDKEFKLRNLLKGKISKGEGNADLTELVAYTPNSEEVVAIAAIVNNTGCGIYEAEELIKKDQNIFNEVLRVVTEDRRGRELEQANFTFKINRISLAGLTHMVRHRIQSIIVPSFTEFGKTEEYIVPDTIAKNDLLLERYNQVWKVNKSVFSEFKKQGVLEEDLVYLYLSGNLLSITTTMNGRQLYHFLRLRTCDRAQWGIRNIAIDMLGKLRKIAPGLFSKVGPACFMSSACPEGKMSCGKMKDIKEFFAKEL